MVYNKNYKKKSIFYLNLIFFTYVIGIILKKIFLFQDGVLDILILSLLLFFLVLKPKKLIKGIKKILINKIFLLFLLFSVYYFLLSFTSYNSIYLIALEYLSVLKWLIYFFVGYLFSFVYTTKQTVFPSKNNFVFIVLLLLIYSILTYNWSGIGDISTLFGFYENSYSSIFSLRSVFALFGFIVFIYALKNSTSINLFLLFSSLFFLFMSGNRKMLIAYLLIILFLQFKTRYRLVLKIFRAFISIIIIVLLLQSSLVEKSIAEYSNLNQPRLYTYINSFKIANDYFPIGSGPATFASKGSMVNYSPIYHKYGMDKRWGFRQNDTVHFYNDTYWAQIIGQYGFIGTILLLIIYLSITKFFWKEKKSRISYGLIMYILLFISFVTPSFQRIEIALFIFFVLGIKYQEMYNKKRL